MESRTKIFSNIKIYQNVKDYSASISARLTYECVVKDCMLMFGCRKAEDAIFYRNCKLL